MRIGILEDELFHALLIKAWLEEAGHSCVHYSDGQAMIDALAGGTTYDLLILDWLLPGLTGKDVLCWIRQHIGWDLPVVFMTALDSEENVVSALQAGADDYMVKPIRQMEMLARLTALARRLGIVERPQESLYKLDPANFSVLFNDGSAQLTHKEFELFAYLLARIGALVSRKDLMQAIWSVTPNLATRTVDQHAYRIRKALQLDGSHGLSLDTVYGFGYRLKETNIKP